MADFWKGWMAKRRGFVCFDDPAPLVSNMAAVRLSPHDKRLLELRVVPPQSSLTTGVHDSDAATEPDWRSLFEAAQLSYEDYALRQLASRTPPYAYDLRRSWIRKKTPASEIEAAICVEAAAFRGKPVYFQVIDTWTRKEREQEQETSVGSAAHVTVTALFWGILVSAACVAAVHNFRLGRADQRGALRLAVWIAATGLAVWLLQSHHSALLSLLNYSRIMQGVAWALFGGVHAWLFYLAIEPFTRKWFPNVLISLARVLQGRMADPFVGAGVLVGVGSGMACYFLEQLNSLVPTWLGLSPPFPITHLDGLQGVSYAAGELLFTQNAAIVMVLVFLLALLLLFRGVMRSRRLAVVGCFLVLTVSVCFATGHPLTSWLINGAKFVLLFYALLRFGVWSVIVALFVFFTLYRIPITLNSPPWLLKQSLALVVLFVGAGAYGFYLAVIPLKKETAKASSL